MIESIEEDCLRQILKTGQKCPISIIYLETSQLPARFHIWRMMAIYLHYLLQQKPNSLLHKFFNAQQNNPIRGDWISNMKRILTIIEIKLSFTDIKNMKKRVFMKKVDNNIKSYAFKYLQNKIKSKGKEIVYDGIWRCQDYLMPNDILSFEEQTSIFSYRSRTNKIDNNFSKNHNIDNANCRCGAQLMNEHIYSCLILNERRQLNIPYKRIFNGSLHDMKKIVNIMNENMKKLKSLSQAQDI